MKSKAGVVDRRMMVFRVSIKHSNASCWVVDIAYGRRKTCHIRVQTCFNSADGLGGGRTGWFGDNKAARDSCLYVAEFDSEML